MRSWLALALIACSSGKDKPAAAPPPAPPRDAAIPEAASAATLDASAEASGSMLDACDQVYIDAAAATRTLLFSCLGLAIDLPRGMSADGGPRDLDGVVVDITSVGTTDDGEVALGGRIDAARSEFEASVELSSPDADTIIQIDGDELRGTAVAPARSGKNRVHRVFRDGERSGLRGVVVTPDGLHTLRFSFISALPAAALERRVLPLMNLRPMTASEVKLAPPPDDMKPLLVDRVLPLEKDGSKHELVLCGNGTYHLTAKVGELAQQGKWRMSMNTLWINHKGFLADGVFDDGVAIHVAMFGTTTSKPPFAPAGDRCAAPR